MSKKSPIKRYEVNGKILWAVSFDKRGYRVRVRGFFNKNAAQDYFETAERKISTGDYEEWLQELNKKELTFNEVFQLWAKSPKGQRPDTIKLYKTTYENYLKDYFGKKYVNSFDNSIYHRWIDWFVLEKNASAHMVSRGSSIIRVLMNYSFSRGYINNIPTVQYQYHKNVKPLLLNAEKLFEILQDDMFEEPSWSFFRNIVLVQFFTMCRIGEVLALKKEDIDFDKGTVSITKTLKQDGRIGPTKNGKTNPEFPMNDALRKILKEQCFASANSEWLFPAFTLENYTPGRRQGPKYAVSYGFVAQHFQHLALKFNIPGLTSHQIRKTAISHLVNTGCSIKTAERAARITAAMILRVYSDVEKERFHNEYENAFQMSLNRQAGDK